MYYILILNIVIENFTVQKVVLTVFFQGKKVAKGRSVNIQNHPIKFLGGLFMETLKEKKN